MDTLVNIGDGSRRFPRIRPLCLPSRIARKLRTFGDRLPQNFLTVNIEGWISDPRFKKYDADTRIYLSETDYETAKAKNLKNLEKPRFGS